MKSLGFYCLAALFEIFGCFTFWLWLRSERSPLWVVPGIGSLVLFALALTQIDAQFAGRTFAAYGGIYIVASLLWLWVVEGKVPDLADVLGSVLCVIGAGIILFGPWRSSA